MEKELIPHLFRTEYRKIVSVLSARFGIAHIEICEDIASDTFLLASETWGLKGLPENPTAWLYTVAKNKTKDHLKRNQLFLQKVSRELLHESAASEEMEIDLSEQNIQDSQLAMIFACCHPANPEEAQIALALNLLAGFGVHEIARAFLTTREVIYKRLQRAKQKLKGEQVAIKPPSPAESRLRMTSVLRTLYLLFNEGYYSAHPDHTIREELCMEAMRLNYLLLEQEATNQPSARALLALMCFQSSRLRARAQQDGAVILYADQDVSLWDEDLIKKGKFFLDGACQGTEITKYHLEAGIAWWHTVKEDSTEKWEQVLQLYNHLLCIEYSPVAALNRTYALYKVHGKEAALAEAAKIALGNYHLYHMLLAELYQDMDNGKAIQHLETAASLTASAADQLLIAGKIRELEIKKDR